MENYVVECPKCSEINKIETWDKIGEKYFPNYTSLQSLINEYLKYKNAYRLKEVNFICPECKKRIVLSENNIKDNIEYFLIKYKKEVSIN